MESDRLLLPGIIIIDMRDDEERLMQEIAVSEEMNEAGGKGYIPAITQVQCVTEDSMTVNDALTLTGDHDTPCQKCKDQLLLVFHVVNYQVLGLQMKNGNHLCNKMVHHRLYKHFAKEEYSYMRGIVGEDAHPRIPLLYCIEHSIKDNFSNEDGRPFVGFRNRHRGHRNRTQT